MALSDRLTWYDVVCGLDASAGEADVVDVSSSRPTPHVQVLKIMEKWKRILIFLFTVTCHIIEVFLVGHGLERHLTGGDGARGHRFVTGESVAAGGDTSGSPGSSTLRVTENKISFFASGLL